MRSLEDDLRERLEDHPDLDAAVRAEYERARRQTYSRRPTPPGATTTSPRSPSTGSSPPSSSASWKTTSLLPEPWLAGPGARLAAGPEPPGTLLHPAARRLGPRVPPRLLPRRRALCPPWSRLFDERHNPLFRLAVSADGARAILDLFRKIEPGSGALLHDFEDPAWNTRFLGDLYQDLSEAARKRYALLQTPEFVEEFILDRTLEPAMDEIGYQNVTMIDPACGSGHFVLGAFHRIFERSQKAEPGTEDWKLALRAIEQVAGVDVNPFASRDRSISAC